jgi:hypothetical protein
MSSRRLSRHRRDSHERPDDARGLNSLRVPSLFCKALIGSGKRREPMSSEIAGQVACPLIRQPPPEVRAVPRSATHLGEGFALQRVTLTRRRSPATGRQAVPEVVRKITPEHLWELTSGTRLEPARRTAGYRAAVPLPRCGMGSGAGFTSERRCQSPKLDRCGGQL